MNENSNMKKYEKIYEELRSEISNMQVGEVFPSIRDLMKKYQVSQITINKVLELLKRDGHIQVRPGQKTIRAINGDGELARVLNIVFAFSDYPSSFSKRMESYFVEHFKSQKYNFTTVNFNYHNLSFSKMNLDKKCDFLIMSADLDLTPSFISQLMKLETNVIFVDAILQGVKIDAVCADNKFAGALVAHYFVQQNHQQHAILMSQPPSHNANARAMGFIHELQLHGHKNTMIDCQTQVGENATVNAYNTFRAYIDKNGLNFSSLFCDSDLGALGVLKVCNELGIKIPDDLELIGCDNILEGEFFSPALSSIDQRVDTWASAVERIIDNKLKSDNSTCEKIYIDPVINFRETTRARLV